MQTKNNSLRNMLRTLLLSALCTFTLTGVQAATLNVPAQYPTIQAAVDAAAVGDTVLVASGTYTGLGNYNIDFKGKDLTVKSSAGANACIIDCQNAGRGFYLHTGETAASRIDGFTIKSGYADGMGGGVSIGSNGTVANCILSGNTASHIVTDEDEGTYDSGEGGGMYGGTATNCTFNGNSAGDGGGMANGTAVNCILSGNTASHITDDLDYGTYDSSAGGGLFGGTATNCTFNGNGAGSGGGMANGTAINCTFNGNHVTIDNFFYGGTGSGMDSSTAINCLFTNHSGTAANAMSGGSATNCTFAGNPDSEVMVGSKATNCIFWNNSVGDSVLNPYAYNTVTYSDIQGGTSGVGNISVDPGFVNAAAGNYRLLPTSHCIDAATTSGLSLPATDIDGNTRISGKAPDMGAYEYHPLLPPNFYARNDTSGQINFWKLNGNAVLTSGPVMTFSDPNWKIATAADLFRKGNTDLIWRNDATGEVAYWDMNGPTLLSSGYLPPVTDHNWKIVGSCDLFHQGNTDLIWQNRSTGDIVYWDMNGATLAGYDYLKTVADLNWQIVAITDLFLTGHSDLIWQNTATGDIVYWDLNGTSLASSGYIATLADKNWRIVGSADLFRQNHTDLIWQHGITGDVVYWDLTGATLTNSGYLFTIPDPQMKIHAIR